MQDVVSLQLERRQPQLEVVLQQQELEYQEELSLVLPSELEELVHETPLRREYEVVPLSKFFNVTSDVGKKPKEDL